MLFGLNNIIFTEFVAVISSTVPNLIFIVVLYISLMSMLFFHFLFLVLIKLSLERIILEGVFRRHFFGVGRSMRWIRLNKVFYLLLELCLSFVNWHSFGGYLTRVGRDIRFVVIVLVVGWRSSIQMIESVLLKDGYFEHFLFEIIFLVLIIVTDLWKYIGFFLLALVRWSRPFCICAL